MNGNPEGNYKFPDEGSFTTNNVSLFLERRCGSIDCHGQIGRGLRLYSDRGLRLEHGTPRSTTTTDDERKRTTSRCGARAGDLAAGGAIEGGVHRLQLFKKPLEKRVEA